MSQVLNFIVGLLINLKGRRLDSGSNFRRPIIGSNFGANIGPQLSFEPRSIIGPALSIANIASLGRSLARSCFPTWVCTMRAESKTIYVLRHRTSSHASQAIRGWIICRKILHCSADTCRVCGGFCIFLSSAHTLAVQSSRDFRVVYKVPNDSKPKPSRVFLMPAIRDYTLARFCMRFPLSLWRATSRDPTCRAAQMRSLHFTVALLL